MNDNELIYNFLEGKLTKEEIEIFTKKLDDSAFNQKFKDYLKLVASIKVSENKSTAKIINYKFYAIAASIAILICIGIGILIKYPKFIKYEVVLQDTIIIEVDKDTIHDKIIPELLDDNLLFSENFIPNQTIEGCLIEKGFRKTGVNNIYFSPVDSSVYNSNQKVPFKISIENYTDSLQISVYDNKYNIVESFNIMNNYKEYITFNLNPGIYYWKIDYDENTIWGGRFFIKP